MRLLATASYRKKVATMRAAHLKSPKEQSTGLKEKVAETTAWAEISTMRR